jgi:hypothetical protein
MSSPTAALYRLAPLFAVIFNPTLLYLLSVGLSLYLVYQNHKSATEDREKYEGLNIQGAYLDRDIHQISFIVWSGMNQLKRKSQGVSTIETWTVDFSRNRFVINANADSVTANYAERVGDILVIKNPVGTIIKRLYLTIPFDCLACKDSSSIAPTYNNFATNYTLARVVESERDQFAADLDRLRACAIHNFQSIPVGEDSNTLLAGSAFAISKSSDCFYYIPPTQLGILLSNGVLETSVTYSEIPYAFCGSM